MAAKPFGWLLQNQLKAPTKGPLRVREDDSAKTSHVNWRNNNENLFPKKTTIKILLTAKKRY
jgi:hypothetical protein